MSTTRYVRVGIVALVVGLTVFVAVPGPASAQLPLPLPLPVPLPGSGTTTISPDVTSATGAVVTIAGTTTTLLSTGTLTSASDALAASLDTASIAGLGTAGTLEATTIGNGDYVASASSLGDLVLAGGSDTVSAALVMANAFAGSATYGYSLVDGLVVNGVSIVPTGDPNQTVYVGDLMIVLNEVTQSANGIAVTALHITTLDGSINLALASASAAMP